MRKLTDLPPDARLYRIWFRPVLVDGRELELSRMTVAARSAHDAIRGWRRRYPRDVLVELAIVK